MKLTRCSRRLAGYVLAAVAMLTTATMKAQTVIATKRW